MLGFSLTACFDEVGLGSIFDAADDDCVDDADSAPSVCCEDSRELVILNEALSQLSKGQVRDQGQPQ